VLIIGKFVFFLKFSIIPLPPSPLTQSVWQVLGPGVGAHGWVAGNCKPWEWCLSGGWLRKWKPLDDPGIHYPQAIVVNVYYMQINVRLMSNA
jgi:hypothetical protein